jgi:hypothetical protein
MTTLQIHMKTINIYEACWVTTCHCAFSLSIQKFKFTLLPGEELTNPNSSPAPPHWPLPSHGPPNGLEWGHLEGWFRV